MKPATVATPYMTAHETVEYLKLGSLTALYRAVHEHGLPYGRIGKHYRFRADHIDRWIEVRGVQSVQALQKAS